MGRRTGPLRTQDRALDHEMIVAGRDRFNVSPSPATRSSSTRCRSSRAATVSPWGGTSTSLGCFLAPFAVETTVSVRLGSLRRRHMEDVLPVLAGHLLPARTSLSPGLLTPLPSRARSSGCARGADRNAERGLVASSERAMCGVGGSLRSLVSKLTWDGNSTTWSYYYDAAGHYSTRRRPTRWPGWRSSSTSPARRRPRRLVARSGRDVLPLVLDLANPRPSLGWADRQRDSLGAHGPADAVLALVLHLAVGDNVPLDRFVSHLLELGPDVLVECVPKDDPKVRVLLATGEDVFDDYTPDAFEGAASALWAIVFRRPVQDTERVLYHLRRDRPADDR